MNRITQQQLTVGLHDLLFQAKGVYGLAAGYVNAMLEGKVGDLTDEQREALKVIHMGLSRIYESCQHAVEYTGCFVSSDNLIMEWSPISLGELVEQAVASVKHYSRAQFTDIQIPDDLPLVRGIPRLLEGAIRNILDPFPYEGDRIFGVRASLEEESFVSVKIHTDEYYHPGSRLVAATSILKQHGSDLRFDQSDDGTDLQFLLPLWQEDAE